MQHITHSEEETAALAQKLASSIEAGKPVLLHGNLGMGKSVFARALIRTLCGDDDLEVPSPTFTLVQTYETPENLIWHFDLYRLKDPDEVYELGWEEALEDGIILVEWPEKLGSLIPANVMKINFSANEQEPSKRVIEVAL